MKFMLLSLLLAGLLIGVGIGVSKYAAYVGGSAAANATSDSGPRVAAKARLANKKFGNPSANLTANPTAACPPQRVCASSTAPNPLSIVVDDNSAFGFKVLSEYEEDDTLFSTTRLLNALTQLTAASIEGRTAQYRFLAL